MVRWLWQKGPLGRLLGWLARVWRGGEGTAPSDARGAWARDMATRGLTEGEGWTQFGAMPESAPDLPYAAPGQAPPRVPSPPAQDLSRRAEPSGTVRPLPRPRVAAAPLPAAERRTAVLGSLPRPLVVPLASPSVATPQALPTPEPVSLSPAPAETPRSVQGRALSFGSAPHGPAEAAPRSLGRPTGAADPASLRPPLVLPPLRQRVPVRLPGVTPGVEPPATAVRAVVEAPAPASATPSVALAPQPQGRSAVPSSGPAPRDPPAPAGASPAPLNRPSAEPSTPTFPRLPAAVVRPASALAPTAFFEAAAQRRSGLWEEH